MRDKELRVRAVDHRDPHVWVGLDLTAKAIQVYDQRPVEKVDRRMVDRRKHHTALDAKAKRRVTLELHLDDATCLEFGYRTLVIRNEASAPGSERRGGVLAAGRLTPASSCDSGSAGPSRRYARVSSEAGTSTVSVHVLAVTPKQHSGQA